MESSKSQAGKPGAHRLSPVAVQSGAVSVNANGRNGDDSRSRSASLPAPRVFSQVTSPNTKRFLKKGESIVGEAGVRKLENGKVPLAKEIRAESIKSDITHKGAGLHEIVPTNLRSEIAAIKDQKVRSLAAQGQSGLRTSTALTPLRSPKKGASINGHSGAFLASPSASASSICLTGQKNAHDALRVTFRNAVDLDQLQSSELLVLMANAQLSVMPAGIEVLHEPGLEDAYPNIILSDGQAMGPVPDSDDEGDSGSRHAFVKLYDDRRETFKDRTRAVKRSITVRLPEFHRQVRSARFSMEATTADIT